MKVKGPVTLHWLEVHPSGHRAIVQLRDYGTTMFRTNTNDMTHVYTVHFDQKLERGFDTGYAHKGKGKVCWSDANGTYIDRFGGNAEWRAGNEE